MWLSDRAFTQHAQGPGFNPPAPQKQTKAKQTETKTKKTLGFRESYEILILQLIHFP